MSSSKVTKDLSGRFKAEDSTQKGVQNSRLSRYEEEFTTKSVGSLHNSQAIWEEPTLTLGFFNLRITIGILTTTFFSQGNAWGLRWTIDVIA